MRFFKHGDSLAIVLPEKARKSSSVTENDEFEFLELEPGVFILVSESKLKEKLKRSALLELLKKTSPALAPPSSPNAPIPSHSSPVPAPGFGGAMGASERKALERDGFLVVDNEAQARVLSQALERDIKSGDVIGVRAFDKKFYIVTSAFHAKLSALLLPLLKQGDASPAELATQLKLPEPAVIAVLQVMKDAGDVIEKRKGLFKLI